MCFLYQESLRSSCVVKDLGWGEERNVIIVYLSHCGLSADTAERVLGDDPHYYNTLAS
jgi:hypothetical protein